MADQALWFKLWCSSSDDPALDSLSIEDFGRWCKLGALTKAHGTGGALTLIAPARVACAMFQVPDFSALLSVIRRFPHVKIVEHSGETSAVVAFDNWSKYQGNLSTPRVAKFREMKRLEEKRRDETRRDEKLPPSFPSSSTADSSEEKTRSPRKKTSSNFTDGFLAFWAQYPKRVGKDKAAQRWREKGCEGIADDVLAGLDRTMSYLTREGGRFITNPETWLNQGRWRDEPPTLPSTMPRTAGNLEAARRAIEEHRQATEGRP